MFGNGPLSSSSWKRQRTMEQDDELAHATFVHGTRMLAPSSAPRRRREEEEEEQDLSFEGLGREEDPELVRARREAALAVEAHISENRRLARNVRHVFVDYCYWRLLSPSGDDDGRSYTYAGETFPPESSSEIFKVKEISNATGTKQRVWCHFGQDDKQRLTVSDVPTEFPRRVNVGGAGTSLDRIWFRAVRRAWLAKQGKGHEGDAVRFPDVSSVRFFEDSHRQGMMSSALKGMRQRILESPARAEKLTSFAFDSASLMTVFENHGLAVQEFVAKRCDFFRLEMQEHDEYFAAHPGQAEQPESYTLSGGQPGDPDLVVSASGGGCTFWVWINQLFEQPNKTGPPPATDQVYEFFSVHLNLMLLDFVRLMR